MVEPNYFVLHTAVITSPGTFSYELITVDRARCWLSSRRWQSCIAYPETAAVLSRLTGIEVGTGRCVIKMAYRDEALVFRLVFGKGETFPTLKQARGLSPFWIRQHSEIGLLTRTG
jgi:hypothetical protein